MSKNTWNLTQEAFDDLLVWLDPNREEAAKKYENIRFRIIKIFTCRGCPEPEDIADETFNRVARKVRSISEEYSGDPAPYFFAVANHVHQEYLRKPKPASTQLEPGEPVSPPVSSEDDIELEFECLENCVQTLPPENRELILQYYQESKQLKIEIRKQLAQRFGLALSVLRVRAHRIRATLYHCVLDCLERNGGMK